MEVCCTPGGCRAGPDVLLNVPAAEPVESPCSAGYGATGAAGRVPR